MDYEFSCGFKRPRFLGELLLESEFLKNNSRLFSELHPNKNTNLDIETLKTGSNKKANWICKLGHEWEAVVAERSRGSDCPYCKGRKAWLGFNDLATLLPDLAKQWHPVLNGTHTPSDFTAGSSYKAWWVCSNNHEWQAKISDRKKGNGCLQCRKERLSAAQQTLPYTHPELAQEWNTERNSPVAFKDVSHGSNFKAWWLCSNNHEWQAKISDRLRREKDGKVGGCPECFKASFYSNENSLKHTHPEIAKEWSLNKNGYLTPCNTSKGSNLKIWWECDKNHEWQAEIRDRTGKKSGCPVCASKRYESQAESVIKKYLILEGVKVVQSNRTVLKGQEIDLYAPELNIAIEYNGLYWHGENNGKDKHYHYNKWLACKEKGIQLIQIWEDDWVNNQKLILNILKYKMKLFSGKQTYARKTEIVILTSKEAKEFFNKTHIQGFAPASIYVGLKYEGEILALMGVKVLKNNVLEIVRYSSSTPVVGGFSKILKYLEKTYKPYKIVTFSDNTVSDGNMYALNGFTADKEIKPDYCYVVKGKRVHKFNYRLKRFKEDPSLIFIDGATERELAAVNNLDRIWDAGKIRWVKTL